MISPPYLKKGDKVGVVAPAGKINKEVVKAALTKLHEWGLDVVLGKNLFEAHFQFAGTDEQRQKDFQQMLDDTSLKAIICARGGYGILRIIDQLNFDLFRKHPKWIAGYSDVTVLHSHIHKHLGVETIHSVMPIGFQQNMEATETLRCALFNDAISYDLLPHPLNKTGNAEGELTGGNISLLYALQASVSEIETKGKLLFIEDISEYLYHLDRMLISFKRSGKLSQLAGLVVGGLTDMKDNETPFGKSAEEIILDAVSEYSYPVCFNFPAGHIEKNLALVFGRRARFTVTKETVTLAY